MRISDWSSDVCSSDLMTMALSLGHVTLNPFQAIALLLTGMLGVLPFCALGMFVGTLIKGQGAPGMLQLIYLPMSFMSGLWFPLPMLPKFLQQIAPVWPSYHLDMLALAAVGMNKGPLLGHVLVLVGFAAVRPEDRSGGKEGVRTGRA